MDHVRWLAEPTLRRPVVIAAFTGWNDAGDAASNAIQHLVTSWNATPLAEIDPEEFTDFATVRPHVRLRPDRSRQAGMSECGGETLFVALTDLPLCDAQAGAG